MAKRIFTLKTEHGFDESFVVGHAPSRGWVPSCLSAKSFQRLRVQTAHVTAFDDVSQARIWRGQFGVNHRV